jgi:hypothetical protein
VLVRSAAADVRAPDALRERLAALEPDVEDERAARRLPRRMPRWSWGPRRGALAGLAAAAAALALVFALAVSGTSGSPTVAQAADLSTRAATLPAPRHVAPGSVLLDRNQSGVAFPYWEDHFRWAAKGARTDTLNGRHTTTVFYTDRHGRRIAYAIVSGPPLQAPPHAEQTVRNGVPLSTFTVADTTIVTWERAGHSCVLASRDVPAHTLQALASWRANGSIPY